MSTTCTKIIGAVTISTENEKFAAKAADGVPFQNLPARD
jgi:hypothetical protein